MSGLHDQPRALGLGDLAVRTQEGAERILIGGLGGHGHAVHAHLERATTGVAEIESADSGGAAFDTALGDLGRLGATENQIGASRVLGENAGAIR